MDTQTEHVREKEEARIKAWWCTFAMPGFGRQRQEDYQKSEVSLACTASQSCLKQEQKQSQREREKAEVGWWPQAEGYPHGSMSSVPSHGGPSSWMGT